MGTLHYIAMSGAAGCIPEHCEVYDDLEAAVADLAQMFDMSIARAGRLREARFVNLPEGIGADYAQIAECECDTPQIHSDSDDWVGGADGELEGYSVQDRGR